MRKLSSIAPLAAAALLLAACSRPAEQAQPPTTTAEAEAGDEDDAASSALHAAITPAVAAALSAGAAAPEPGVAWRKPHDAAGVDAVFAEARVEGKPVFMYWGAVWCPPCNEVKATIFSREDFIEASREFLPLYIDGDVPGAQKLGARFHVSGYPTMILFRPDGGEITRLPGGEVSATKYLQLLATGLQASQPIGKLLQQARTEPRALKAADWRLLAYYAWDVDEQQLLPQAQRTAVLQQLARACPPEQAATATRLALQALLAQAQAQPGVAARKADAASRQRVLALLADPAAARENLDIVTYGATALVGLLSAPDTPERQQLMSVWATALDRLTADVRLSQGARMSALLGRIELTKLGAGAGGAAAAASGAQAAASAASAPQAWASRVLIEHVRRQVARADSEVTSDVQRQSVIPSAADALAQIGLLEESDRLLEAELQRSHSPYYAMLQLADNAKQRGDEQAALGWYERAWHESKGPATRVQWGSIYVEALVELAPQDTERIASAATAVLADMRGQPDAFYGRSRHRLEQMSQQLMAWWANGPQQREVIVALRQQRDALCKALPAADPQRGVCQGLFSPSPAHKPAPARA